MSDDRSTAQRFELGSTPLIARAVGGVETCYQLPGFDLNLDIGRCPDGAERQSRLLLTHAHIDHAAGLPYYVSLRGLYGFPPPTVYAPRASIPAMSELLSAWGRLQSDSERCTLVGVEPGETVDLGRGLSAEIFSVDHGIDSVGYTIRQRRRKLLPELAGAPGHRIRDLADAGETIHHHIEHPELSFAGDTTIEVLRRSPQILESRVLLLECTFVGPGVSSDEAKERGHVHLEQLIPWADHFRNERVLLTHFSQRHERARVDAELEKLPVSLRRKVEVVW